MWEQPSVLPQISRLYYCHQPLAWQILLLHFAFLYLCLALSLPLSFYFPKTSLPLFSPLSLVALHASPCIPPGLLSVLPHLVTALFLFAQPFLLIVCTSSILLCPYLYSPFCWSSSTPPLPPLLSPSFPIVWWICRQGLIIVLQPKCSFFFVFESCDRQGLFFLYPIPPPLFLPLSFSCFSFYLHTMSE